jgi:hypothetical protein
MKRIPVLVTMLLAALVPAVWAEDPGWTAELGFAATVPTGTWVPLRLSAGPSVPPWVLDVTPGGRFRFPGPGTWEVPVFVPAALETLGLTISAGGWTRQEFRFPAASRGFPGHLILTDGLGPEDQERLEGLLLPGEPIRVEPMAPASWPTSALGWEGVSAVVAQDPGTILSPAQIRAVEVWIASGGHLVLVGSPENGSSVAAQIGSPPGLGTIVHTPSPPTAAWGRLLNLQPFGTVRNLGTNFGPERPPANPRLPGISRIHIGILVGWGVGLGLLGLGRKRGWPPLLVWTALAVGVVIGFGPTDADRGILVHTRQIVLPGDLGRYVQTETEAPPGTSPWALAAWKQRTNGVGTALVADTPRRVVTQTFEGPLAQPGVRVTGAAPVLPESLTPDRDWLLGVIATAPQRDWVVGGGSDGAWIELLPREGTP